MDYREMAAEFLRLRAEHLKSAMWRETERQVQGELLALDILYDSGGGVYPQELSRKLFVSSARVAAMLRDMYGKGWIVRAQDPEDNRHVLISLSDKGRSEAAGRRERTISGLASMLERLGEEDTAHLIRILRRMSEL